MKTLIKSGLIVMENSRMVGDVFIDDERISKIDSKIDEPADQIIDAGGKILIPGGIDVHTHFNIDVGVVAVDDFKSGTTAAAFGGTTTIVDHMGFGPAGCNLHHQLEVYKGYTNGQCVVDYGIHGVIQQVDDEILDEMASMVEEGITSFKIYMTYDYKVDDYDAIRVLKRLKDLGAVTTVHCENDGVIRYMKEKFISEGKLSEHYHPLVRPNSCESEAVLRMISLAEIAENAPLYIVHVSAMESVEAIRNARAAGFNVYGETCPQYLFLDEESYDLPDHEGLKYIMSPPLRAKENQEKIWQGICDGTIQTVATDHCTFDFNGDKQRGRDDFTKCPNGGPGVETRVPLIYSEGVAAGRIDLNQFADIVSTNPAKIFGLYPKKGVIAVGSDADIVMIDPEKEVTITKSMLHEKVDYTLYEGFKVKGYPVMSMVRGTVVTKDGELLVKPGFGQMVRRGRHQKVD